MEHEAAECQCHNAKDSVKQSDNLLQLSVMKQELVNITENMNVVD